MPQRMLRPCTDSELINAAGDAAEVMFYRLIQHVDDYGCITANPKLLKGLLYSLRDDVRTQEVTARLKKLQLCSLVSVYEVALTGVTRWLSIDELAGTCAEGAKRFLVLHNFGQRMRESKRKCPSPPTAPPPGFAAIRGQPEADIGDSPQVAASRGNSRPYSDAHSDSESEAGAETGPAQKGKKVRAWEQQAARQHRAASA